MRLLKKNIMKLCTRSDSASQYLSVFSAKSYDQHYFTKINETLPIERQLKFDFF